MNWGTPRYLVFQYPDSPHWCFIALRFRLYFVPAKVCTVRITRRATRHAKVPSREISTKRLSQCVWFQHIKDPKLLDPNIISDGLAIPRGGCARKFSTTRARSQSDGSEVVSPIPCRCTDPASIMSSGRRVECAPRLRQSIPPSRRPFHSSPTLRQVPGIW